MSVNTPSPAEGSEQPSSSGVMSEAEALVYLLDEMGCALAIDLSLDRLMVEAGGGLRSGAFDVLNIVAERFCKETDFREDMFVAVGNLGDYLGDYLANAPGIDLALKTAPAAQVIQALATAGLLIRHHYERNDGHSPMISFMPVPGNHVTPNAHMLMKMAVDRFDSEPEFAAAVTRFVVEAGQSQHSA